MTTFSKVIERDKLKPKREPYWTKLMANCHLGFRKMTSGSDGTYIARFYDAESHKKPQKSLGAFSEYPDHERYDLARKDAFAWFEHLGRGGSSDVLTVRDICLRYISYLKKENSDAASIDVFQRFSRYVYTSKLSKIDITKLKPAHIEIWRETIEETPNKSGSEI